MVAIGDFCDAMIEDHALASNGDETSWMSDMSQDKIHSCCG
jgi:hypothetical protein